jgi:hypothetical protein
MISCVEMDVLPLTPLERELLECCCMAGETTTTLDEEMLQLSPGRAVVEATLRDLLARGLVTTNRDVFSDVERVYEDDWWDVTENGRKAIGLPRNRLRSE